jgi:hypothetical protein
LLRGVERGVENDCLTQIELLTFYFLQIYVGFHVNFIFLHEIRFKRSLSLHEIRRSLNAQTRDPNFGKKLIVKAKRMRKFFQKKLQSESEANAKVFSAKRSEANSLRFRNFSQFCEFAMRIWTPAQTFSYYVRYASKNPFYRIIRRTTDLLGESPNYSVQRIILTLFRPLVSMACKQTARKHGPGRHWVQNGQIT